MENKYCTYDSFSEKKKSIIKKMTLSQHHFSRGPPTECKNTIEFKSYNKHLTLWVIKINTYVETSTSRSVLKYNFKIKNIIHA